MTLDRTLRQKPGKPGTDLHAGWCGRGAALCSPPYADQAEHCAGPLTQLLDGLGIVLKWIGVVSDRLMEAE